MFKPYVQAPELDPFWLKMDLDKFWGGDPAGRKERKKTLIFLSNITKVS